jgi:hypothetical protein
MKRFALMVAIGFVVIGNFESQAQGQIERHAGRRGWTIKQQDTFTPNDGSKRIPQGRINHFDANGHRREVLSVMIDGEVYPARARIYTSEGIFISDPKEQKLFYEGEQTNSLYDADADVRKWKKEAGYIRDEVVAGWKCAVFPLSGGDYGPGEVFVAYNLGGFPLKMVQHSPAGTRVLETVSIEIGPVSPAIIDYHPEWPIDFSFYERLIEQEETRPPSGAPHMRETLSRARIRFAERSK